MAAKKPSLRISVLLPEALTLTACDVEDDNGDVDFRTTTTLVGLPATTLAGTTTTTLP